MLAKNIMNTRAPMQQVLYCAQHYAGVIEYYKLGFLGLVFTHLHVHVGLCPW